MSDRRTDPDPAIATIREPGQIAVAHTDLCASPDGPRDRQLLLGDQITVLGRVNQHSYIRADKDGYVGYVLNNSISAPEAATHQVTGAAIHSYAEPSIKSPDLTLLSFGARLHAVNEDRDFIETKYGFVPRQAVSTIPVPAMDPIATARLFLGTPYLWGGNTRAGLDCSGLVQAAYLAAGIACPGDSDQQLAQMGSEASDKSCLAGDLLFWKGHVALVTSPTHMIHANAFHMSVVEEPIAAAIERIAQSGGGPVTGHKRH